MVARLNGYALSLKLDGTEYMAEISEWKKTDSEKDSGTVTFDNKGGVNETISVTIIQSLDAAALMMQVYNNPGKRDVPFTLAPAGNEDATQNQPHITGKLNFPKLRPEMGQKAGEKDGTTEISFEVIESSLVTS